jgi:hypothetical protein
MKLQFKVFLLAVIVLSLPGVLLAEDYEYHPLLSDTFSVYLGAMKSSNSFKFESDALDDPGDYIDFDDSLHVSDDSTFLNGLVRWKFGSTKKWALAAQYFSNNEEGSSVLTDDIEWDGLTFLAGSTVDAGIKLKVARLFLGRSFYKSAQSDFGAGVGIHDLDISAYIEGVIFSDDETNISEKAEVGASQPLPNIGAWYFHSPAKKWLIHSRVDWISAEIGDYDGGLWNVSAGVNYQAFRHVGFDLSWQYFDLHVKVDKSSWRGKTKMTYSGPVLAVTFNW